MIAIILFLNRLVKVLAAHKKQKLSQKITRCSDKSREINDNLTEAVAQVEIEREALIKQAWEASKINRAAAYSKHNKLKMAEAVKLQAAAQQKILLDSI